MASGVGIVEIFNIFISVGEIFETIVAADAEEIWFKFRLLIARWVLFSVIYESLCLRLDDDDRVEEKKSWTKLWKIKQQNDQQQIMKLKPRR